MTHLLLTLLVFVVAGLGLALGVLGRGRPLGGGCHGGGPGRGCARRGDDPLETACDGDGGCARGRERT